MKSVKLNLGCGLDHKEGFVNIDAVAAVNPDLLHDLHQPLPFADNSVSEILAQDILEHFTKEDSQKVVAEICRVLKKNGTLKIRVPNVDDIVERFANDPETRNEFLYGTTLHTGIFGAHKVGYSKEYLITLMLNHNLVLEKIEEIDTNFVAEFKKKVVRHNKKLLLINQTLGTGGAEVFITDLLESLQNFGWQVKAYSNNDVFLSMLRKKRISSHKVHTVIDIIGDWKGLVKGIVLWPFLFFEYLKIFIREKDSGVFFASGFIEKILGTPLAYLFQIPSCWIEFGPMKTLLNKFFKFPKLLYFLVKHLPLKIIVPTFNTRNHLIPEASVSLSKLQVIPCGRNLVAKKTTVNKNIVVCVSRLEKGKGQDILVQAFKQVIKEVPNAKLHIVGEGSFKSEIEATIKKEKLEKNVFILGRVPNSLTEMETAKLVVFPSVWELEGFGLVQIEAMSLGKPIIAFNSGPATEIIQNNITGILVEKNNIKELAEKIILLLKQKKLRETLAKNVLTEFTEKYTVTAIGKQYDFALTEVLNRNQARKLLE